jgi:ferredoxin-NADP reductase
VVTPPELRLTVRSVRRATPTARVVQLDLGGAPFPFEAGQAAMIGIADRPERVPYSIACAPEDSARTGMLEFLIRVESSGRWGHLFDNLSRGMALGVRGPYGSFVLPAGERLTRLLFIAGGTGISPVRAMVRHLRLTGRQADIQLLYSARSAAELAFLPEFRGMARRHEIALRLHVTREAPPRWRGERGRFTLSELAPLVKDTEMLCYVCGPATMVHEAPLMLQQLGVEKRRIRLEEW